MKLKSFMNGLLKSEKLPFVIIFLIGFLMRIPRGNYIYGNDTFEVIWMAKAIINGALFQDQTWLIHPLSFLGFFPFSHYPIGLPLVLSAFLKTGISLFSSIILLDFIIIIFGYIGVYKLSSLIFKNNFQKYIFIIFFLIGSTEFYGFTYCTLHPRGFLLAFSNWFLYYIFLIKKEKKYVNYIKISTIFICLILTHRIGWMFLIYVIVEKISSILEKNKNKLRLGQFMNRKSSKFFYIFILLLFMTLSFLLMPFIENSAWSPFFSNDLVGGQIMNIFISYFILIGFFSIMIPLGFIELVFSKAKENSFYRIFILISIIFITILWKQQIYTVILFSPVIIWISVIGLEKVMKSIFEKYDNEKLQYVYLSITLVLSAIVLHLIYSLIVVPVYCVSIMCLCLLLPLSFFMLISKLKEKSISIKKWKLTMIISLIISSQITLFTFIEGRNIYSSNFEDMNLVLSTEHITLDEIRVSEYINSEGFSGIVFTSSTIIGRRIGGYGFLPTIPGKHHAQQLYYGWQTEEYVLNNVNYSFITFLQYFRVDYIGNNFEQSLINQLKYMNVSILEHKNTLVELQIQYIICLRDIDGEIIPFLQTSYGNIAFPFFESLSVIEPNFTTDLLFVWQIY